MGASSSGSVGAGVPKKKIPGSIEETIEQARRDAETEQSELFRFKAARMNDEFIYLGTDPEEVERIKEQEREKMEDEAKKKLGNAFPKDAEITNLTIKEKDSALTEEEKAAREEKLKKGGFLLGLYYHKETGATIELQKGKNDQPLIIMQIYPELPLFGWMVDLVGRIQGKKKDRGHSHSREQDFAAAISITKTLGFNSFKPGLSDQSSQEVATRGNLYRGIESDGHLFNIKNLMKWIEIAEKQNIYVDFSDPGIQAYLQKIKKDEVDKGILVGVPGSQLAKLADGKKMKDSVYMQFQERFAEANANVKRMRAVEMFEDTEQYIGAMAAVKHSLIKNGKERLEVKYEGQVDKVAAYTHDLFKEVGDVSPAEKSAQKLALINQEVENLKTRMDEVEKAKKGLETYQKSAYEAVNSLHLSDDKKIEFAEGHEKQVKPSCKVLYAEIEKEAKDLSERIAALQMEAQDLKNSPADGTDAEKAAQAAKVDATLKTLEEAQEKIKSTADVSTVRIKLKELEDSVFTPAKQAADAAKAEKAGLTNLP